MSYSTSMSSTPTVTPPSSPELHFCPPAILIRSAEVRAAYLGLHDDEPYSDDDEDDDELRMAPPPPAMELPLNVYTGAPTDEECGLRPMLDVALDNIDARSKPLVSWLRNAPAVTVAEGQTRRTMARALAHYLNVRRSEGHARAVLLVSRTDRTAKAWQEALFPLLDDTLDINVATFFMAKGKRKEAVNVVGSMRFPGLIIASEKGLRCPDTEPGISLLSEAMSRNPHGIKWDLVVSDVMRPNDLNDDISPLRMLANRQTEQALVVVCTDKDRVKDPELTKKHVNDFLRQHLIRFDAKHRVIETVWCTPELLKATAKRTTNDENGMAAVNQDNGGAKKSTSRTVEDMRKKRTGASTLGERTLRPVESLGGSHIGNVVKPAMGEREREMGRPQKSGKLRLEPEMELELEKLRISVAQTMEPRSKGNEKARRDSGNNQESERCVRASNTKLPDKRLKPNGMSSERKDGAAVKTVPKPSRTFISEDILKYRSRGFASSASGVKKDPRASSSVQTRDDDNVIVMEGSDGEEQVFYDTKPWLRIPPAAKRVDDERRGEPARRRKSRSNGVMEERDRLPSSRPANGLRLPSLSPSPLPSLHMNSDVGARKAARKAHRLSREGRLPWLEDDGTIEVSHRRESMDKNANNRISKGRRGSRGASASGATRYVQVKEEREDNVFRRSKSQSSRVDGSDVISSQGKHSGHSHGTAIERKDRRRKKLRRSSSMGESTADAGRGSQARSRPSLERRSSLGISPTKAESLGTRAAPTKPRKSLTPRRAPPAANDDVILVVDSPDSRNGVTQPQIENEIWVISSDEDALKPAIQKSGRNSKSHPKKSLVTNSREPVRPKRSKARGTPSDVMILTDVNKLRQDINAIPAGDRRKYNEQIARGRAAEGKGPEGLSEALQFYLQALDIYDGDDFLTTRILALSTVKYAWDDDEDPSWARSASRSPRPSSRLPIAKKRSNGHRRRQSRERPSLRTANRVTNNSAASGRRSLESDVIVIDD